MSKEEAKKRIQVVLDFAIYESKNERNSEDIKTAYNYKRDAFETALKIIEEEIAEDYTEENFSDDFHRTGGGGERQ